MIELDPTLFGEGQPCFGCAPDHPIGFRLRFSREADDVVTRFVPGERFQGPPGIMHGGLVTTLADEIGAWTLIGLLGKFGFTAQIEAKLLRPIRIGVAIEGRGRIQRETARIVYVAVQMAQGGFEVFKGEFAFVLMDQARAEQMLGQSLPEAWKKFCR